MTAEELHPYLGCACTVRLHCRSCGGTHVLEDVPALGRYAGEVLLSGNTFHIEDIEQVWRHIEPPRPKPRLGLWALRALLRGSYRRAAAWSAEVWSKGGAANVIAHFCGQVVLVEPKDRNFVRGACRTQ